MVGCAPTLSAASPTYISQLALSSTFHYKVKGAQACVLLRVPCGTAIPGAVQNAGSGSVPGSTKLGDYIVEPERPSEVCGVDVKHGFVGQLTQRIFYKDRLVTEVSFFSFVSPWNPSRLLYSVAPACADGEKHAGTFYFDGSRACSARMGIPFHILSSS
jgi:hypothetical protein